MPLNPWDAPPRQPQRYSHPRDAWAAAKQIDGLGGEWTYQVFNHRALNFHLTAVPPHWAEPLSSFDSFCQEVWLRGHALGAGVRLQNVGSTTVAFKVFPSVFSATSDKWPMPEEDERSIGCHAVSIVGIEDEDTLLFQHGWPEWPKDHALGRLTREYVDNHAIELWVIRPANYGPQASTVDRLAQAAGKPEFKSLWASPGLRGVQDVGPDLQLRWWETYSLEEQCPGEVLCLVFQKRLRVATAMVTYCPGEATIFDLFVWPGYRRGGYGSLLESSVADRARLRGADKLNSAVLNADMVKGGVAAMGFLESRGYSLTEYSDRQLQIFGSRPVGVVGT
jgi:GNAT superfamily N-acetyltransferase